VFHARSPLRSAARSGAALLLSISLAGLAGEAARAGSAEAPAPAPPGLEALLAGFRELPGVSARFREERRIALLREPLVSSGRVYFAPPDRLARHVEAPLRSTALLEGGELLYGGDGESHRVDLATNPAVRAFVDAFRMLLAGDLAGLQALYEVGLAEDGEAPREWTVALRPRSAPLRGAIASIELQGRDRTLLELRIRETNGDETRMDFSEVRTDHRFTDAELAELFRLPGS